MCSKFPLVIALALNANTPESYERSRSVFAKLLEEGGLCAGHTKIRMQLLASSGDHSSFQEALELHTIMVRMRLFSANIEKELSNGGDFIVLVQNDFPGDPATLAERIFEAADFNPVAMAILVMFGRTPDEIATGTTW
jgi:hypothetical protein